MSDVSILLIVTGLALISVVLTFVLFRFFQSQAEGKGKLLGGTIQYGGSLAGFVLIFSILFGAFYRLRADPGLTTPISLAGDWALEEQISGQITYKGTVTIRQRPSDPVLEMGGEVIGGQAITFSTIVGVIRDRNVYFIYENMDGERGVLRGQVTSDSPKSLRLVYTDLVGYDKDGVQSGILLLTRRP